MQVLIVPDSFKESLSSSKTALAIEKGIKRIDQTIKIKSIPFSDGGEGAITVLENFGRGKRISCTTVNPIGRPIKADYFLFEDRSTAWIELSQASGLALLSKDERNPLVTSTYGTGLQIKDALERGCNKIVLGIGGSATNDAGAGILEALGGKLIDKKGNNLKKGGEALGTLNKIILPKKWKEIQWQIACDVDNPLLGLNGASTVYAPQKGATPKEIGVLEANLSHFANYVQKEWHCSIDQVPGGGAAGGTAAGMLAFFNAKLFSGFKLLAQHIDLEKHFEEADLIFTAEGKIDWQSLQGKVPVSVARLAKKHYRPCIGLTGSIEGPLEKLYQEGFSGVFNIQNGPISLEESMSNTAHLLEETTARVFAYYQNIKSL